MLSLQKGFPCKWEMDRHLQSKKCRHNHEENASEQINIENTEQQSVSDNASAPPVSDMDAQRPVDNPSDVPLPDSECHYLTEGSKLKALQTKLDENSCTVDDQSPSNDSGGATILADDCDSEEEFEDHGYEVVPSNVSSDKLAHSSSKESTSSLRNLLAKINKKTRMRCQFCPAEFRKTYTLEVYKRHKAAVHDKTFVCPLCEKGFSEQYELKRHSKSVRCKLKSSDDRELIWPSNVSSDNLAKNSFLSDMLAETGQDIRMRCPFCPDEFRTTYTLERYRRHKAGKHDKIFVCPLCEKGFSDQSELNRHSKGARCKPISTDDKELVWPF